MDKGKGKRNMDDGDNEIIEDDPEKNVDQDDDNDDDPAPNWVVERMRECLGRKLRFVATKKVSSSDLKPRQNRFRFPTEAVDAVLRPLLSPSELEEANLLHPIKNGTAAKKRKATSRRTRVRKVGRNHGGHKVNVFTRVEKECFCLSLTCWDSSGATVLKGEEYMKFCNVSGMKRNDVVNVWCFRQGPEEKLCFIIGKPD